MPGASSFSVAPPLCTHNTWGSYMTSSQPSQLLFFCFFLSPPNVWAVQTKRGLKKAKKDSDTLPVMPSEITPDSTLSVYFSFFSLLFLFGVFFLQTKRCSERSSRHFDFKRAAMQPCRPPQQLPTFSLVALMLIFRGFDIHFKKMSKYNKTTYF